MIWTWASIRYRGAWRTVHASIRALVGAAIQPPAPMYLDLAASDGSVLLLQAGTSDLELAAGDGAVITLLAGGAP